MIFQLNDTKKNLTIFGCLNNYWIDVHLVPYACWCCLFIYCFFMQLRQLCKISGVQVSFDTENARSSFYRAAVNFVLDDCSRYILLLSMVSEE